MREAFNALATIAVLALVGITGMQMLSTATDTSPVQAQASGKFVPVDSEACSVANAAKIKELESQIADIKSCDCQSKVALLPTYKPNQPKPAKEPKPITTQKAVTGHWETVCNGGTCSRRWVSGPAKQTQSYSTQSNSRPRLFNGRFFGRRR